MILYAESSAVLAWLLGQNSGEPVRLALTRARHVVSSDLTRLECQRAISRLVAGGVLGEADAKTVRSRFAQERVRWTRVTIADEVIERSGDVFPVEPVRALDAIHLASALLVREEEASLVMLSLDDRVRRNADALGIEVLPAA